MRSPWIVAPAADLLLVIATPLIIWGGLTLSRHIWTPEAVTSFALVWAIGHHLPGMMRAYGDQALFRRFTIRFLAAPVILTAIGVYGMVLQSSAIPLAVGLWGWWHYLMQAYGFLRIYDAKAGSVDRLTCRLDQAMCLVWFAAPTALTSNGLFSYLNLFYKAGGPLIPPDMVRGFQIGVLIALVGTTTLFVIHTVWQTLRGRPPSRLKLVLMLTNFGYYWYCLATVSNLLISYALYELFHDIQYLTIVWAFNQQRAQRDRGAGAFTQYLFRQRWWLIAVYLALILTYGLLNAATRSLPQGTWQRVLLGVFVASTVLHYYYDGFIWKLRESDTRKPLGLDHAEAPIPRQWAPAWSWMTAALALCALGTLVVVERRHVSEVQSRGLPILTLEKHDGLVQSLPQSVFTHQNRGLLLSESGRLDEAETEFRRARELNPYYAEVPYNLAHVLLRMGRTEEALSEYRTAVRLNPQHAEAHYNIGVLLLQQGHPREAVNHLETAAIASPGKAEIQSNWGTALARMGQHQKAIDRFRSALEINPNLAEAHANYAQSLAATGKSGPAIDHARRAVQLQPELAAAHYNLGVLLEQGGHLHEAEASYREALELKPQESAYWNNLGVVLAKQNRLDGAIHAFRQAVTIAPNDVSARQNLQQAESLLGASSR